MLQIRSFPLPPVQTNAFLLSDASSGKAVLIDAPQGVWETISPILQEESLILEACVLTHAHFDHVLGASTLNDNMIPLSLHQADKLMFDALSQQMTFFGMDSPFVQPTIDTWLEDGSSLELLGRPAEIRRVPGHAEGNIVIYLPDEQCAFVGDAIFAGSVGRTDLPGGSFEVLEKSIKEQIYTLPDETTLYPGHGPETTVAREKASNPYVQG
ncbi:MBL fold metallo-hydrolase [Rubellicoccus peritrichatus]|uniref:MBL fold metallo-hydrolase n=1 Tax=Rubellicoccus peritrichatus TaxID=3080537 RepID=A0AAQ3LCR2_9BACT|nr:MBL fold metallo-hydrolase [Puniceicoccus sp. CR14]WOO42067.1 MBL fold metallo-hydrolase [Puniceicoccus sp. CR14]